MLDANLTHHQSETEVRQSELASERQLSPIQQWGMGTLVVIAVVLSAIVTKEARTRAVAQPLVDTRLVRFSDPAVAVTRDVSPPAPSTPAAAAPRMHVDPSLRWFDARPVRPARVLWMTVTAYSPDPRSCGTSADGLTATMHCVTTNAHLLAASDPRVLPYGSMLTIPGYGELPSASAHREHAIIPVLDCGGAIKGYRLDVLFPTHEEAMRWGVRTLPVTVWAFADGSPRENPRRKR
jgi:3D (Asp-Asp-Asp) domain-containing protein